MELSQATEAFKAANYKRRLQHVGTISEKVFSNHISSSIPGNLNRCHHSHALLHGQAGFIWSMAYKGGKGWLS